MVKFSGRVQAGNFARFEGRSSRGAYWWFALWVILISIGLSIVDAIVFRDFVVIGKGDGPLEMLFSLATLLPSLAAGARRLRDIGRAAWRLRLILTVVGVILLIWWYCQPGERKENRFGADAEAGRAWGAPTKTGGSGAFGADPPSRIRPA